MAKQTKPPIIGLYELEAGINGAWTNAANLIPYAVGAHNTRAEAQHELEVRKLGAQLMGLHLRVTCKRPDAEEPVPKRTADGRVIPPEVAKLGERLDAAMPHRSKVAIPSPAAEAQKA